MVARVDARTRARRSPRNQRPLPTLGAGQDVLWTPVRPSCARSAVDLETGRYPVRRLHREDSRHRNTRARVEAMSEAVQLDPEWVWAARHPLNLATLQRELGDVACYDCGALGAVVRPLLRCTTLCDECNDRPGHRPGRRGLTLGSRRQRAEEAGC